MKRILCVLIIVLACGVSRDSEGDWTVLEKQFREVPMEARSLTGPLFWLHGDENDTRERLEFYLEKVAEGNNGSFCAESRPHSDWLGPRWFDDLDICLQKAKELDLKMWIFDERWWPSQTIAGKVPERYAAKRLETTSEMVTGPARFSQNEFGGERFITAIAGRVVEGGIDGDSLIDLRPFIREGSLDWDVPAGNWQVMKFTWTIAPPAAQGGHFTIDGASQDCVDWFLQTVYQPHYDRFKDDFGKTIAGFFYDEPETQGDWGTELSKVFAERGVDEKKALVAWKFQLAGDGQAAAKYQYVDALGETWGRTMYCTSLKWCEDRGVDFIGHFIEHGGWYLRPGHGAINLFQMQKYNSMGGMDLVCRQLYPGERHHGIYQIPKLTSSISHAYGKKDDLAMCEIFGAYGQDITYPQMKWLCDWHQVRGVNFMITHSFNPKAPNDTDCPPYFYNGGEEPRWPLYRIWADYSSRLSLLLTGGEHVCPVAILFPGSSAHAGKAATPEDMTTALQDAGYDSDWLPYEVFEGDARIVGSEIHLHDERYRALIVPPVEVIPYETLAKVKEFFDSGGVVIGYDFLPTLSATLGRTSAEIKTLVDEIWGPPTGKLPYDTTQRRTNAQGGQSYFAPAQVTRDTMEFLLSEMATILPEVMVLYDREGWVHTLHRRKDGRDVVLICNQHHEGGPRLYFVDIKAEGIPEIWDPMRNEITSVDYLRIGDTVCFDLTLEPMESVLVVFRPDESRYPRRLGPNDKPVRTIPIRRDIQTEPRAQEINLEGCPWVWYPEGDPRVSVPPGTRWFRATISLPEGNVSQAKFLLTADNEFTLFINGREVEKTGGLDVWKHPKEVDIAEYLKSGKNVFAVAATNTTDRPSPAGLIGRWMIEFSDGGPRFGETDGGWKVTNLEQSGWMDANFDDSEWPAAKVIARFGDAPWGRAGITILPADPFVGRCNVPSGVDLSRTMVYLEMDDVEEGASVKVNGQFAGGFIGKPFRLDVTKHVKVGENVIDIQPYAPKNVRLATYEK